MKKKIILILSVIIFFIRFALTSFAEITVVSVKGQAKYKTGRQWIDLKPGLKLPEGVKISTGVKSGAVLNVNGSSVTISQMSMLKIEENNLSRTESNTTIGLKRGGLRARVSRVKTLKTSFKISTPIATSSVRGTEQEVFYGPGTGMLIKVLEGEILGENMNGLRRFLRGKLTFRQDNGKPSPDNIAGGLIDETKGGLIGNLTDEEKQYLLLLSDFIPSSPDQGGIGDIPSPYGTGNVTVSPVFP
ncbi:MAG: FecR domain-containing protein [Spirochaetes bacterium]|nr:FecR domain-containing protein [Spirochaetota bacterium]